MSKDKPKILIIDDDPTTLKLLNRRFINDGYEVFEACNGLEAIDAVKEIKPDCIILDVVMPKLDGLSAARRIKEFADLQNIPIVFITIRFDVADDKGDLSIDLDGHPCRAFAKPLHIPKLLSTVRKEVNRYRNNS